MDSALAKIQPRALAEGRGANPIEGQRARTTGNVPRFEPPVIELSLHADGSWRSAQRHCLRLCRHIAAFRFDAPLSFANTAYLEREVLLLLGNRPGLRHVLFVSHGVSEIDDAGAEVLGAEAVREAGYRVAIANLSDRALEDLGKAGVADAIGIDAHACPACEGDRLKLISFITERDTILLTPAALGREGAHQSPIRAQSIR